MLRIYDDVIALIGEMRPAMQGIARQDQDLARQMRRAFSSVAVNLAEGAGVRGGLRRARYETPCVDVARAMGYVRDVDDGAVAKMNRIVGTLVKLLRR